MKSVALILFGAVGGVAGWFVFGDPLGIKHPAAKVVEEERFDNKYVAAFNGNLVTDKLTGAQYMFSYQGCIIKLETVQPEKSK